MSAHADEHQRLRDEVEQLRTALESAVEENHRLVEDRDRLRQRITILARDLQSSYALASAPAPPFVQPAAESEKLSQSEEELRVAFEELQVLTEELEAANVALATTNRALDARVAERTQQFAGANAALKASEASFRAIADVVPDLLWRADVDGAVTWFNSRWYDYTGQTEQALGSGWMDAVHPDDLPATREVWVAALRSGQAFQRQHRLRGRDGDYRWFIVRAEPLGGPDGRVGLWFGSVTDINELIHLQERQAVLLAELQHRTRNLMAIVEAIVRKTLAGSRDIDEAGATLAERLAALSRVQNLLSRRPDGGRVTFDTLLSDELSAHVPLPGDGVPSPVTLDGPQGVELRSTHVQTLALGLHELTTNAVKYGALAGGDGRLSVRWRVRGHANQPSLIVEWRESGVRDMPSPKAPPRGGGYGRKLIEKALPHQLGAKTDYRFETDGVHCTIEMPLPTTRSEYTRHA